MRLKERDGDGGRAASVWTGRTWAVGRAEPVGQLELSRNWQDWSFSEAPPGTSGPDKSKHRCNSVCIALSSVPPSIYLHI